MLTLTWDWGHCAWARVTQAARVRSLMTDQMMMMMMGSLGSLAELSPALADHDWCRLTWLRSPRGWDESCPGPWAWRHKSGLRVEGARHAVTRYFCVSGDQCSVTSCAPLLWSLIMTITSGEHSSPGPLSAADILDFLRNNIWSSISFPLKIKSFGWMITKRVRYHCIGIVRVSTDFSRRIWCTNFLFCMTSAVTIHERRPSQFIIYHSWEQPFKRHETLQCHYLTLASWFVSLFFFLCSKQLWPERRRER